MRVLIHAVRMCLGAVRYSYQIDVDVVFIHLIHEYTAVPADSKLSHNLYIRSWHFVNINIICMSGCEIFSQYEFIYIDVDMYICRYAMEAIREKKAVKRGS